MGATEMTTAADPVRLSADALRDFAIRVLTAAGATHDAAELCAQVFVDADLAGTDSHGIARLPQYAAALTGGRVSGDARPEVVSEGGPVLAVEANNCMGPVALAFATDRAVDTARRHGVAVVTVRGSNHAGGMAWYTERATRAGMFAMVLTGSTKAMVAPTHGAAPFLGTNAVAYGSPAGDETLSFDAALSVASRSRLEAYERAGKNLPEGWAIGPDGLPAVDPGEVIDGIDALSGHSLLPFGGADGEHKGFGISLLVELLCGPVAGARWGPRLPESGPAGVGHFVLCLDLGALGVPAEEVEQRVESLCAGLRAVPATAEGTPVRMPGERRTRCTAERTRDGVPVPAIVLAELDRAAALVNVAPLDRTPRP
ncbi:Ldh family oxidoreductase [Streptomyces sp. NPDC046805]|uniref:Ldh family oxidoreductase n=1 Tax=Streptomyces sp. NPDC046805 TaxID=3155134 RepID=UPI0033F4E346